MKQLHIDSTQQIERGLKRGRFFEKLEQVVFFCVTVFMKSNLLYHDHSFFSIFFSDFSISPCPGRHKTEAKYIAAIKLKLETFF
jgi:hypothetical protein